MINWGDKDAAERLAEQVKQLLRDRTMTFDQLASVYSIKHGQSVTQQLKDMSTDKKPMKLGDFLSQLSDLFELVGKNQVKANKAPEAVSKAAPKAAAPPWRTPAPATTAVASAPAAAAAAAFAATDDEEASVTMKYADVSRAIQNILKEHQEPVPVPTLENIFEERFRTKIEDVVGMSTGEYLERKENIFDHNEDADTVCLQSSITSGPPMADPNAVKDEVFVVKEFESLVQAMGPIVYISTLCGKFIQRNGKSVTSIISTRPLDLFKRHPGVFLIVGAGNVTLKKYEHLPEVQRLLDKPSSRAQRVAKAAEEAQLPIPEVVTEQHVVDEFRRLIPIDGTDSVYISSLCGRFLQRFKTPVTAIIDCKPAEFLRRYPDIFVMTGGGNVGLREVLGPDAVSVPPPPPRVPKVLREEAAIGIEALNAIQLTDQIYEDIHARIISGTTLQSVVQKCRGVCQQIETACFLALEEVVLGGAAGKGLLAGGTTAEIVLFVKKLPYSNFSNWLPHILDTLAPVLEHQLASHHAEKFKVDKDHLSFQLSGGTDKVVTIEIYLSPVFTGRDHLLESIRATPPAERFYFYPAMIKERNEFVGGQSPKTKKLIRLMTWWVSKQHWSSQFTAPSDWLVELIVVYACQQLGESDDSDFSLADMLTRVLEVFANFESIKVFWADSGAALYKPQEIWRPLLSHEPLFMDPLNPYINLVDVNNFDSHELATAAELEKAFLCFRREAAQFVPLGNAHEDDDEDNEDED